MEELTKNELIQRITLANSMLLLQVDLIFEEFWVPTRQDDEEISRGVGENVEIRY